MAGPICVSRTVCSVIAPTTRMRFTGSVYPRLLPTTRPHLLREVLTDLCRRKPPRGPPVFEWTRFCVALGHRELRPRADGPLYHSSSRKAWSNRAVAHRVDTVVVAIDWRLMWIAMQLRFIRHSNLPSGSKAARL